MKVRFTGPARRDLQEIGDWIFADSPRHAMLTVDRLQRSCLSLSMLSGRWPVVTRSGLRRKPDGSYLIFDRVLDEVQIVRVLHAARDWPDLLDDAE